MNMLQDPTALIVAGVALVIVMLIMMREYKAKNFKELAEKFDVENLKKEVNDSTKENEESEKKDTEDQK